MAAQFTGKLVKVEGPARSGKTEQLLAHIASLIEGGTQPGAIALACNTAFAAQAARERLAAMLGEGGETLARQVAMGRAADFCEAALATLGPSRSRDARRACSRPTSATSSWKT